MQLSRVLTFLLGCILVRIILAVLAYHAGNSENQTGLVIMGWGALIIAVGFIVLYIKGGDVTADKQLEIWEDDKKLWWSNLRIFHGMMYLAFFISAVIYKLPQSYLFLVVDVIVGLLVWIAHNLTGINF